VSSFGALKQRAEMLKTQSAIPEPCRCPTPCPMPQPWPYRRSAAAQNQTQQTVPAYIRL